MSPFRTSNASAQNTNSSYSEIFIGSSDSPNVVTSGLAIAADSMALAMDSLLAAVNDTSQVIVSSITKAGTLVSRGVVGGATALARGVGFIGGLVIDGAVFVFKMPGNALEHISNTSLVSAAIRPVDHTEVPIIDPNSPELYAALNALPPAQGLAQSVPQSNAGPIWPMQGRVTTEFGVAHWPYQPSHTGIDISDSQPSGVTSVKAFRSGKVVDVVVSKKGLGNHVIVDHGNGVTSVYGHLSSITVQVGQEVDTTTTLGQEGNTGVSTGTHLHFEIRVNGQATDPYQFIGGHP